MKFDRCPNCSNIDRQYTIYRCRKCLKILGCIKVGHFSASVGCYDGKSCPCGHVGSFWTSAFDTYPIGG